jgi:hypothetical protein
MLQCNTSTIKHDLRVQNPSQSGEPCFGTSYLRQLTPPVTWYSNVLLATCNLLLNGLILWTSYITQQSWLTIPDRCHVPCSLMSPARMACILDHTTITLRHKIARALKHKFPQAFEINNVYADNLTHVTYKLIS